MKTRGHPGVCLPTPGQQTRCAKGGRANCFCHRRSMVLVVGAAPVGSLRGELKGDENSHRLLGLLNHVVCSGT